MKTDQSAEVVCEDVPSQEQSYTILVVDDEKLGRMVTRRRLSKLNHRVLEAENGRQALEILQREKVDLVLSDWDDARIGWPRAL